MILFRLGSPGRVPFSVRSRGTSKSEGTRMACMRFRSSSWKCLKTKSTLRGRLRSRRKERSALSLLKSINIPKRSLQSTKIITRSALRSRCKPWTPRLSTSHRRVSRTATTSTGMESCTTSPKWSCLDLSWRRLSYKLNALSSQILIPLTPTSRSCMASEEGRTRRTSKIWVAQSRPRTLAAKMIGLTAYLSNSPWDLSKSCSHISNLYSKTTSPSKCQRATPNLSSASENLLSRSKKRSEMKRSQKEEMVILKRAKS